MAQVEYGRIIDGKVVEYPVYELHIKNRAHPKDWYTEVIHLQIPAYDDRYESIRQELEITGNHIVAKYIVYPLSVDAILNKMFYPNGQYNPMDPMTPVEPLVITVSEADPELVDIIVARVSFEIGQRLDEFAKIKHYDDIKSAATYLNSSVPQFKADAERVVALRDQTYAALYQYIVEITTGVKPVPKSFAEIDAVLPVLTWE